MRFLQTWVDSLLRSQIIHPMVRRCKRDRSSGVVRREGWGCGSRDRKGSEPGADIEQVERDRGLD